jgi:alkylated DNA repair protein (DNA oxidative demethylase)
MAHTWLAASTPIPPMPSASLPLFASATTRGQRDALAPGTCALRGLALDAAPDLLAEVARIAQESPFRHLVTPGGCSMSVAMTNCGAVGWWSDRHGYRYTTIAPLTARPWPRLPPAFPQLARTAAATAGFVDYAPDVCLVNRYAVRPRLTPHRDSNEHDRRTPIASVSLGLPITFLWGGLARTDRQRRVPLEHGDVVVWGGPARMVYHGVLPIRSGRHPATGAARINLTFRLARAVAVGRATH